jgi:uncharacterized Zn finger protein
MAVALSVGTEIDAFCPACKNVRKHAITAMKGTRAAKTECRSCGSVHPYRKNPPDTKAKKRSQYEDAMEGRDVTKPIPYRLNRKLNQDDVIQHKAFGVGLVIRVVSDKKIEVLFEDSSKLLVHGR